MDIEKEINLIKERNKKVEADKAWEMGGLLFINIIHTVFKKVVDRKNI